MSITTQRFYDFGRTFLDVAFEDGRRVDVTFSEKLQKIVSEQSINKSKASRDAGLPESTISSYLAKPDSLPRVDIALKLSNVLGVPLHWLADDSMDWPPPTSGLAAVPDHELMQESCGRLANQAARVSALFNQIDAENWQEHAEELLNIPLENPLPDRFERVMHFLYLVKRLPQMLKEFDAFEQMKQIRIKGSPAVNVLLYDVESLLKKDTDIDDAREYRTLRELADAHRRLGDESAVKGLEDHRRRLLEKRKQRKLDTAK